MSGPSFVRKNPPAAHARTRGGVKALPRNLRIGDAGDHFEREADRMADWVVSNGGARRDWSLAQMRADTASGPTVTDGVAPSLVHDVLGSSGRPLEESAREKFESGMDHDLSQVRIHADDKAAESADAVKAAAYTVGNDVVFGRGQFQPGSSEGERLLAHELAHTTQQQRRSDLVLQRQGGPEKKPEKREETAAAPEASEAPAPDSAQANLRKWPSKLPRAVRGKETQLKKVPNKLELENVKLGGTTLDTEQQNIVAQIKTNREQLAVYPWLQVVPAQFRYIKGTKQKVDDPRGGFFYPGESPKTAGASQRISKEIKDELGKKEGKLSAVNTYDDAYLTLGSGLTAALLSKGMEKFFSQDEVAKNKFLDAGVAFSERKLLLVNTDNGAVEEDPLRVGDNAPKNARMLFSISQPLVSLFVHLAESSEHGPALQAALQQSTQALQFPPVVESWSDMGAVRLAAHLIHWRSSSWTPYAGTGGNVANIMKVYGNTVPRDADVGNAHVLSSAQGGVLFGFAGGKARQAFSGPVDLGTNIAPNSLSNKLLVHMGGTSYLQLDL